MEKSLVMKKLKWMLFFILFTLSTIFGQNSASAKIDLQKARGIIDSLDRQFSRYFFNGDSLALYAMYTKDGSLGSLKGKDLLSGIGRMIRSSIQNNTRTVIYTTTSLTVDAELIIEVGMYESIDDAGNVKGKGKYLVVWKQENGDWKLYRDIGL